MSDLSSACARGLDALMYPRSIAIVGASEDAARIGGRPLAYLRRSGFTGALYPVNAIRTTVQGLTAYRDIDSLPEAPDLVIVAVSADAALEAVAACARRRVPAMVIFSADFAETGAEGLARQARMETMAAAADICILGPNCLGAFNASHQMFATFSSVFEENFPTCGNVGIVSQSGGYGGHIVTAAQRRGVRVGQWLTTGNEAGVDVADCLAWMVRQAGIDIVLAYAEGVRNHETLTRALNEARTLSKPVLFVKAGVSTVGAMAAQTHTAALAGADKVFDGMLRQHGALRMPDTEAMVDTAYLLQCCPRPQGARLGIASISGAVGVQMADSADLHGLSIPAMPMEAQRALREINPFAAPRNPVDITAQAFNDMSLVERNFDIMLAHGAFDAMVTYFGVTAGSPTLGPKIVKALAGLPARYPAIPMVLCAFAPPEIVRTYEKGGYAVFEDPARAVAALGMAMRLAALLPVASAPTDDTYWAEARARIAAHDGTEKTAKDVLDALGVATPARRVAADAEAAVNASLELGFPVALKLHGAGILHKSELGGVVLDLDSADAVREAVADMSARIPAMAAGNQAAHEGPHGFLVERMVPGGVECFIGLQHDPQLGPMVAIGFGGVLAELFQDVVIRLAPLTEQDVHAALAQLRSTPLLYGYRGRPACDVDALVRMVVRLSAFFAANADVVSSIEVNPVMVLPQGQGVVACDAVLLK
jgi:acyl-CoA synthetase (NDP forming)